VFDLLPAQPRIVIQHSPLRRRVITASAESVGASPAPSVCGLSDASVCSASQFVFIFHCNRSRVAASSLGLNAHISRRMATIMNETLLCNDLTQVVSSLSGRLFVPKRHRKDRVVLVHDLRSAEMLLDWLENHGRNERSVLSVKNVFLVRWRE
jgi:hypothetical protein